MKRMKKKEFSYSPWLTILWIWNLVAIIGVDSFTDVKLLESRSPYEQRVYSPISVDILILDKASRTDQFPAHDLMTCSLQASLVSWAFLLCFQDNLCSVYDIIFPSGYQLEDDGLITQQCYTNIGEGCIALDRLYQEGEGKWDSACTAKNTCTKGIMVTETVATGVCSHPSYVRVPGVGCTHIAIFESYLSYDRCQDYCNWGMGGGQLIIVPESFESLREYLACIDPGVWMWVGVENNKWADGTPVAAEDWGDGQPKDQVWCGLAANTLGYKLMTAPCNHLQNAICQLNN